jgi:hypothetical protein
VALSSAAAVTRDLVLTTGMVLLPQRDVIYTAKEVASLDLVSNGGVAPGVGLGWNREEGIQVKGKAVVANHIAVRDSAARGRTVIIPCSPTLASKDSTPAPGIPAPIKEPSTSVTQ